MVRFIGDSNNADPREGIKTVNTPGIESPPIGHSNNADPREGIKTEHSNYRTQAQPQQFK